MKTRTKFLVALAMAAAIKTGGGAYIAHAETAGAAAPAPEVSAPAVSRTAVSGQEPEEGKWGGLGLTDEQKSKMKAVREKYRPVIKPLVKELKEERRALRKLMRAETVDEAAIRAEVQKMASVGADLAVQRAHSLNEMRGILTPEQMQKLKQARAEGKEGSCRKRKGGWMDRDEMM